MATWTTGGTAYEVNDEQKAALDALRTEYVSLCGKKLDRLRRTDERYDGHHIGNPPNPLKPLTTEYLDKVRAILGRNPRIVSMDKAHA